MPKPTLTTSYRIVNIIRDKISTPYVRASDTDVAKALKVSRATVSAWKYGREVMAPPTLLRVQELLNLEEKEQMGLAFDLLSDLYAEHDLDVQKMFRRFGQTVRGIASTAASILLGTVAVLGLTALPAQRVAAAVPEAPHAKSVYYVKWRRWLRRVLRDLAPVRTVLTGDVTAPAF